VFDIAKAIKDKHPILGHLVLGLKDNAVALTDFRYTKSVIGSANIARIQKLRAAIVAGTIRPPSTREALAAFTPVKM